MNPNIIHAISPATHAAHSAVHAVRPSGRVARPLIHIARLVVLALVGALAAGCMHSSKLPFNYEEDGTPIGFRRVERNIQRNFFHHIGREVYHRPKIGMDRTATADQKPIIEELGIPNFVRKQFVSLDSERVDEWVYVDAMQVFQFVGGKLVYQGPLTDYEQTLLRHGYPSRSLTSRSDTGRREDLFIYDAVFAAQMQQFFFVDGTLKQQHEGN